MRYLSSAIVASIVCWVGLFSELGLSAPPPDGLVVEIFLGLIGTIFIVIGALPPFLLSRWFAGRLHIYSVYYDATCGSITGAVLGPLVFPLLPNVATNGLAENPFWNSYVMSLTTTGLPFLLGGAVGGIVYRMMSVWWPSQ
jgi:hypothetical protein